MKSIFKHFTLEDDKATIPRIIWFVESFSINEFKGVEKMLYAYLEYCSRLYIVAKRKYLESFLKTEGKSVVLENNIKLDNMTAYDYVDPAALTEAYKTISESIVQFYDLAVQENVEEDFRVAMDTWMVKQKGILLRKTMTENFPRATQGETVDDVASDLARDLDVIQTKYSSTKLDALDFLLSNTKYSKDRNSGTMVKIAPTYVPAIDNDIGGMFKGMIYTFTGLVKSGKSRFVYRAFAYVAAVYFHVSVRIDSGELSVVQVENLLIAIHITVLFKDVKIPDSLMNKNELDETQKRYYNAAKEDLFGNPEGKYGKIHINSSPVYIQKFRKDTLQFLRVHPDIQVWIFDYAGLIRSDPDARNAHRNKYENIEELYATAREIAQLTGLGWIILNQYNEKGVEKAKAGKVPDTGDIEGGQSISRYTDYNLVSTQTDNQKIAGLMQLTSNASRSSPGFNMIPFETDLSISRFTQKAKAVTN